jgi:low temperature requirement protein LtrA
VAHTETAEAELTQGRHASWLELFYDLLFVAVVAQLAHGFLTDAGPLTVVGLFVPAWWVWVSFTVFSNVSGSDRPSHRLAVLANMACLLVMAAGVGQALHGHPALFAAGYAASRLVRVATWALALRASGERPSVWAYAPQLLSAALWAASIPLPVPWCYLLWTVALVLEILPGLAIVGPRTNVRLDATHLVERFGLFAIIALGEGIAQIVVAMAGDTISGLVIADGVAAFALLAVMWWLYFDFGSAAAEMSLKASPDRAYLVGIWGFVVGHFLVVAGIMAIAAGLGQVVAADHSGASHLLGVRLVCAGLAAYLTNNAVLALVLIRVRLARVTIWYVPSVATLTFCCLVPLPAPITFLAIAFILAVASYLSSRLPQPR